jgi:hypothetical protein
MLPTTEVITEYKKQISFIQEQSQLITITSQEGLDKATEFLTIVMKVEKTLADRKAEIVKPLMSSLASVRDLFRPLEIDQADAKKTIKSKMLEYTIAEEEKNAKEQARVEARVQKGTMREDTAIDKLSKIAKPDTHLTTRRKFRVTDEGLVPREYMTPNLDKIKEAVLKQGLSITGVEVYEEKSIVGSTR